MTLNASPSAISLGGPTVGQSVNLELNQSPTAQISLNDPNVRTLTGTGAGTALSIPPNFWGKSTSFTLSYNANPTVDFRGANGAWGNNPSDQGGWPYCMWPGGQGEFGGGTLFYPFVAPGGNLWYTTGCDDRGWFYVATTANRAADPAGLAYTPVALGYGFPGINGWTYLGNYARGTIMWFRCDMSDGGGDWGYTFAVSNTASSAGILVTSRSIGPDGKPSYTYNG